MHELSLAESVINIIEDAAAKQHFGQVRAIRLEIGSLSGVESEALRFCFDAVARDTVAQDARLEIIEVCGTGHCARCGTTSPVHTMFDSCPTCGEIALQVSGGTEMRVKELEVV